MVSNLGSDDLTSATSSSRDPWQESLSRWHTVPSSHVAQAAEVIRGIAGSWAASYQFDYGTKSESRSINNKVGNPSQVKVSNLGRPGFPEVNFSPYNHGTNRFGPKGGSMVGHPISFEVVGPTSKNVIGSFYWNVTVLANNDELTISSGALFSDVYGHSNFTYLPGGLYAIITQTGSGGDLTNDSSVSFDGGIGDGCDLSGIKNGIVPSGSSSKYEIFRVVSIRNDTVVLDTNKRLTSYFGIPADPIVQSVMFVQPKATRMLAVPGSGTGPTTARAFAVVPPKRALVQDDQYTHSKWTGVPWNETNLPQYLLGTGTSFEYRYGPQLPIPRPIGYWNGRVQGINPDTGAAEAIAVTRAGTFVLYPSSSDPGYAAASLVGKVIHINNVQSRNGAVLHPDSTATLSDFQRDQTSLMGWFEVTDWNGSYHTIRRVSETDPTTGFPVVGSSVWYSVESTGVPLDDIHKAIEVGATVHNPVNNLWSNRYPNIDDIQSARLTNLIDPRWVERSVKMPSGTVNVPGLQPGRADRAVFNTSSVNSGANGSNSDPGSLLDLGFRIVLYPAKISVEMDPAGGPDINVVSPDWNHPVHSNEVLLDPALPNEKQYVEVDYANGLVRFSHAIKAGSSLYPTDPAVFTSSDNPRGEMVVFACCIPYSMEDGQLGSGSVRVTGGQAFSADQFTCGDTLSSDQVDVYSNRIVAPVDPTSGAAGIISSQNHVTGQSVVLTGDWVYNIPPSGFFELLYGASSNSPAAIGDTHYRGSLFGYTRVSINAGRTLTTLHNVYGGGEYGVDTVDTNLATVAVFRREIVTPNGPTGKAGVDYAYDTTYGSAKKATAIIFDGSDVTSNIDGSVTVRSSGSSEQVSNFDNLFSSWVLETGSITKVVDPGVDVTVRVQPHTVLMRGNRISIPTSTLVINAAGFYYIYYEHSDGKACPQCLYTTSFPLPHPEDILLAKIEVPPAIPTATLTTLQNPLLDVDRRVDLYVGELGGTTADWTAFQPHFKTLYSAVGYANELMNPDSGGRAYQNVRIRVIGRTQEPALRTITIKTDGLVIEGNPFYDSSPAVAVTSEISWGGNPNVTNLIDLNGHSNLVFRNLSFRSNQTTNNALCTAAVFTSTGSPSRVTIDNCRVTGFVNHFVKLDGVTAASEFRITDNVVEFINSDSPSPAGVSLVAAPLGVNQPMPPAHDILISGNKFASDTTPLARRGCGVAIRSTASSTIVKEFVDTLEVNDKVVISGNIFNDFEHAVWAVAQHGEISGNWVNRTVYEGFLTCGGWDISRNHLVSVHQGAATGLLTPHRVGILHYTYQRVAAGAYVAAVFHGTITGNRVELDHDVFLNMATDKAIYVLGSPNNNDSFTLLRANIATGGGITSITLDAGASSRDDYYLGCMVTFTSDPPVGITGEYSTAPITAYNGTTKVATVPGWFGLFPVAGTGFRIDRVNRGSGEVVEGNFAGYTTGGQSMTVKSNIRVHSVDARVNKNVCSTLEVWGADCIARDNDVVNLGVNYDVNGVVPNPDRAYDDRNLVSGNTVDTGFFPWKYTTATDNKFRDTVTSPVGSNNLTFTGNWFNLSLTVGDGTNSLVANNTVDFGMTIGATVASTNLRVIGNTTGSSITIGAIPQMASGVIVSDNRVNDSTGLLGITVNGNLSTIQGNNTVYDITKLGFVGAIGWHNTIVGNTTGDVYVAGGQNVIKGNKFLNNLTVSNAADGNMISDNTGLTALAGVVYINCNDTVITGNMVNDIQFADGLARSVLNGNMVTGAVALSVGVAAANADSVVLSGNWVGGNVTAGNGGLAANSAIAVGNRAGATILAVATTAGNVVNTADNATV